MSVVSLQMVAYQILYARVVFYVVVCCTNNFDHRLAGKDAFIGERTPLIETTYPFDYSNPPGSLVGFHGSR